MAAYTNKPRSYIYLKKTYIPLDEGIAMMRAKDRRLNRS